MINDRFVVDYEAYCIMLLLPPLQLVCPSILRECPPFILAVMAALVLSRRHEVSVNTRPSSSKTTTTAIY